MRFDKTTIIMGVIILVLMAVLLFFLVAKPQFDKYILEKQGEAKEILIIDMLTQIQQKGFVNIFAGNQTIRLTTQLNPNQGGI